MSRPPRIGMDRYVSAEWMDLAASAVRGEMQLQGLHSRLSNDVAAPEVRKKTIGILNRIWFPADPARHTLVAMAASLAKGGEGERAGAFVAVAVLAYPFFRQVLENTGRLLRLQETCAAGEVHRRMFELHGKRTTIDQATSYAFKTMISWKIAERRPDGRLGYAAPLKLSIPAKRLLDIAANGSRSSVSPLQASDPLLFPFETF